MRVHPRSAAVAVISAVLLLTHACGTSGVSVRDDDALAAAGSSTTVAAAPTSTTTLSPTTTSSTTTTTTSTTTTTTTTTVPEVELAPSGSLLFDEEGVPVNGQTSGVLVTPSGWLTPVLGSAEGGGWRVWTPCGREARQIDGEYLSTVDIVLDPGHGGSEPGAVGPNDLREADLNLQVAERAAAALRAAGFTVVLTRDRDARLPIATRGEIALALDPIAFISIHHNAGIDAASPGPGTEMYHQIDVPDSKRLAGLLYEESVDALEQFPVQWVSMSDAGAMVRPNSEGGDYYGVLRRPAGVPSVLAEFAYISNGPEAELLTRADAQDALARSLVSAVQRFTTTDDPGSGFTDEPIFRGFGPSGAGQTEGCQDPDLG